MADPSTRVGALFESPFVGNPHGTIGKANARCLGERFRVSKMQGTAVRKVVLAGRRRPQGSKLNALTASS
jgi:hypothetical protein